jgi:hypothetical protein
VTVVGTVLPPAPHLPLADALADLALGDGFRMAEITYLDHGDGSISAPAVHGIVDFTRHGAEGIAALAELITEAAA